MPKSTFIGLIFLIAALLVASVPELLDPTARGVEKVATDVGLLPKSKSVADAKAKQPKAGDLSDKQMQLRGYEVTKDGDLRDTVDPLDRDAYGHGRLVPGSSRAMLPGERDRTGEAPPATSEDGVLLDITGCPLFRPGTDVAALLANEDMLKLYGSKVEAADDPAACDAVMQTRITAATTPATSPPLGATTARERDSIRRGGTSSMIIALAEIELLSQFMDDASLQKALLALDGASSTATAAGTSAAGTSATGSSTAAAGSGSTAASATKSSAATSAAN